MSRLSVPLQFLTVLAWSGLSSIVVGAVGGSALAVLPLGVGSAVVAVLLYRWIVSRTERRAVDEHSSTGAIRPLLLGAVVGIGLFTLAIAGIAALGGYHVTGPGTVQGLLWYVGFMAMAAVSEELLFRGILLRHVERWFGTWIALIGTGIVFGLMHLLNPDATLWGAIAIAVEAGGMLGAAWIATRRLWLPIGLHLGWNLAESGIFGTAVSGNGTSSGLLASAPAGPTAISGGEFGPEASVVSVAVCLAVTVVLLAIARRRGLVVPLHRPQRTSTGTRAPGALPGASAGTRDGS